MIDALLGRTTGAPAAPESREITPISRDVRLRFAAYVGMLAAYLAAVKNDPLTPYQLAFFGLASAWSLGFEHRFRKPFFSAPIKIALIVLGSAIFVLFISGYTRGGTDDFANSIARFLFWNAIVFVLSRNKSEYDLWTLAIIELSLFMISGAFIQPPVFLPLLLACLACLLYTFQRASILRCGAAGEHEKGGLGLALVTVLMILEVAAVVFLVFPRQSFRMEKPPEALLPDGTPRPPPGEPIATGAGTIGVPRHPEFLDLVNFEKLKADPRPVLKVRIRDRQGNAVPPDRLLYLRGAVLDRYEGGRWRAQFKKTLRKDADDGQTDGWTPLEPNNFPGRQVVQAQIRTSALSGDLSFAPPDPIRVAWKEARYDPSGIVFFPVPPREMIEYYVESALMPFDIPKVAKPPPSPDSYLQLPAGLDRVRDTARNQTQRASEGMHARVSALLQFLRRNGFSYRLGPFVPAEGRDPVEHFLEKREGYCTHYATALALLCRAAGIPARVATGFQLHDPDEDGSFLVRNSDAHAWVEVWFGPEHGWRTYDATPEESRSTPELPAGSAVATLETKKREESARTAGLDEWIRNYDPKAQRLAMGEALSAILGALEAVGRAVITPVVLGSVFLALALAGILYALLPGAQRRRLRQLVGGFRESSTVDFYRDFLWALSRRGIRKHPASTPREFLRQVRGTLPAADLEFLTEKFYETRFRGVPPTALERRRIDEIVAALLRKPAEPQPRPAGS
jgi:transglutaminase-like putative cysteine protease